MVFSRELTRRKWLASSGAISVALVLDRLSGSSAQATDAPLNVAIANTDGSATRILCDLMTRQHFFEDFSLQPKFNFILGAQQLLDSLTKGESDICMGSGVSAAVAAIAAGAPFRLLSGANQRVVQAIYSAKPEIETLKDLEGRRVGSGPKGALVHQIIFAAMQKAGADPGKVDFVNLGSSDTIFKAVAKGEIDAGTGEAQVYENQAKYGVHVLEHGVLWDELPDYTNQGSYASLDAIKTKREQLVRTLAAHARAYRFLQTPESHDPYGAATLSALGHADPVEVETQWSFYQKLKPFAVDLVLSEERIRYIQQLNVAMGLQKEVLPFDAVVDNSLAQEALPRLKS
jgi:ABC-type nitrate/sulfonate/bicarbonate transport system substrate-binding protein